MNKKPVSHIVVPSYNEAGSFIGTTLIGAIQLISLGVIGEHVGLGQFSV